jgi:hypothetical protein
MVIGKHSAPSKPPTTTYSLFVSLHSPKLWDQEIRAKINNIQPRRTPAKSVRIAGGNAIEVRNQFFIGCGGLEEGS